MFDRCLYFNTNHLSRIVEKIWKDAFSELDLAPSHAYLLRLVLARPGLIQREIAEELHLDKSTITRFVDKMVEEGYLRRSADNQGNQKEQCINPTAKAKKIEKRLNEIGDELYASITKALSKESLVNLVGLEKLAAEKL